jgi:hypothetical protein
VIAQARRVAASMRTIGWEYTRCIAVASYVLIEDLIKREAPNARLSY